MELLKFSVRKLLKFSKRLYAQKRGKSPWALFFFWPKIRKFLRTAFANKLPFDFRKDFNIIEPPKLQFQSFFQKIFHFH